MRWNIVIMVLGITAVLGVGVKVAIDVNDSISDQTCCCDNGSMCTDVYYDKEDKLCHLILCEQTGWIYGNKCTRASNCRITDLI